MAAKRDTFDTPPVNVAIHPVVQPVRSKVVAEIAQPIRLKNKLVEVVAKEGVRLYSLKNTTIISILPSKIFLFILFDSHLRRHVCHRWWKEWKGIHLECFL